MWSFGVLSPLGGMETLIVSLYLSMLLSSEPTGWDGDAHKEASSICHSFGSEPTGWDGDSLGSDGL